MATVPAAIVKDLPEPPNEFVALKVRVPAPNLVKLLAPEITPLMVVLPEPPILASEPRATVPAQVEAVTLVLIRAPPLEIPVPFNVNASVAVEVKEKPFMSNMPPELTVVPAPVVPSGPLALVVELTPNFRVALGDPLIVVAPA